MTPPFDEKLVELIKQYMPEFKDAIIDALITQLKHLTAKPGNPPPPDDIGAYIQKNV